MRPLKSEKQIKLFGELLVNFANAKNTDEASKKLIKGIQRAFNFSENFVVESEKLLASLKEFKSALSKSEMNLIKTHFLKGDEIFLLYFLKEEFKSMQRKLIEYNSTKKTFTFQEFEWDADFDEDGLGGAIPVFSKPRRWRFGRRCVSGSGPSRPRRGDSDKAARRFYRRLTCTDRPAGRLPSAIPTACNQNQQMNRRDFFHVLQRQDYHQNKSGQCKLTTYN